MNLRETVYDFIEYKYPFYLGNIPVHAPQTTDKDKSNKDDDSNNNNYLIVRDKYTGREVTRVWKADRQSVEKAIELAEGAKQQMAHFPHYKRKEVLRFVADNVRDMMEEFSIVLALEAGKPITQARTEVKRFVDTFELAAEETGRIFGESGDYDNSELNEGISFVSKRFPVGTVGMISPFNFPLNLVAHKVAPAIAAGCPFVLKPSSKAPISAMMLGDLLSKAGLPIGAFSIVPCDRESASLLTTDPRIKLLTFTGSGTSGWSLLKQAEKKQVVLELGGNAACIVDEDQKHVLKSVADKVIYGAYYQSGQSCISVQRVFIQENIYGEFAQLLIHRATGAKVGDPLDEQTLVGPMISEDAAIRAESWIKEAVDRGATLLCGGQRQGAMLEPTILEFVPPDCKVYCEEVFAPVMVLEAYSDFRQLCDKINESKYGLQAGLFTDSMQKAFYAFDHLQVGGLVVGDTPAVRADAMPYGGTKDSGLGREGVRSAIEHMTEQRVMLMKNIGTKLGYSAQMHSNTSLA